MLDRAPSGKGQAEGIAGKATLREEAFWKRTFVSVTYRDFRLMWLASIVHHLGEWMEMAGLLWFVQHLTGSAFLTSLVMLARLLPMVLLSLPAGLIIDRMSRRDLMIIGKGATSLLSIALAILAYTGWIMYWHILVIAVLGSVATSVDWPARQATLPSVVKREHLMNAVSLDSATMISSRLIGAPVAGFLLAHTGVTFIFGARALGGLVASLLLVRISPYAPMRDGTRASPLEDMKAGWQYLRQHREVLVLVAMFFLPTFVTVSYLSLLPAFSTKVLGVGPVGYGFLQMAPGLGSALSVVTLATLFKMRHKGLLLIMAGLVSGLALIGLSVSRWLPLSLAMLAMVGGLSTTFVTMNSTLVQDLISDAVRGRVLAWRETASGLSPLGSLLAGSIADTAGPSLGMATIGAITIVMSLAVLLTLPGVRRLD